MNEFRITEMWNARLSIDHIHRDRNYRITVIYHDFSIITVETAGRLAADRGTHFRLVVIHIQMCVSPRVRSISREV